MDKKDNTKDLKLENPAVNTRSTYNNSGSSQDKSSGISDFLKMLYYGPENEKEYNQTFHKMMSDVSDSARETFKHQKLQPSSYDPYYWLNYIPIQVLGFRNNLHVDYDFSQRFRMSQLVSLMLMIKCGFKVRTFSYIFLSTYYISPEIFRPLNFDINRKFYKPPKN
eukprot:403340534